MLVAVRGEAPIPPPIFPDKVSKSERKFEKLCKKSSKQPPPRKNLKPACCVGKYIVATITCCVGKYIVATITCCVG